MSFPDVPDSLMLVRHDGAAFARAHWLQLAAVAWRYHSQFGRGALLVHWDVVTAWRATGEQQFVPLYCCEAVANAPEVVGYDPAQEIVVGVLENRAEVERRGVVNTRGKLSGRCALVRVSDAPVPPEAARLSPPNLLS